MLDQNQPERCPVKESQAYKKKWATEVKQRVMGVDPGLAATGVVILERESPGTPIRAVAVRMVKTKIAPKKGRSKLRITSDDQRRYKEIRTGLDLIWSEFDPYAVGVEVYTFNPRQKGSIQGIKTMGVYVGTLFWAYSRNLFAAGFMPSDLKRRFCGKQSASKKDVERAMYKQVIGLEEMISAMPKGDQEHLADAAGHAVLVLEETDEVRKMLGLV